MTAQGTSSTVPMLTRTERRSRGSQQEGVTSTASIPSAAAERNAAPILVLSTIFSRTATRWAFRQISSAERGFGRRTAHSTPRFSLYPVICESTSGGARYTGISPQRCMIPLAQPSRQRFSVSMDTSSYPALIARSMTLGLSAMNIPFSGSRRFLSCASVSFVNTSQPGALRSFISMNSGIILLSCPYL